MTEPTKPLYTPALGSQAATGMAHIRACHPAPVSGSDLAELLGCDSKNVFQAMRRCVEYGLITLNKVGVRNMYQLTDKGALETPEPSEAGAEQLQAYAKRAVIMMRGLTKSSVELAAWCNTTPAIIDKALAPLVTEGKLVRADVLRGGQTMFDYRWGATYVPKDADFDGPAVGEVPEHRVQPVADKATPKAPTKAGEPNNPASPWRKPGALQLPGSPVFKPRDVRGTPGPELCPDDALASGADLGKKGADFKRQDVEAMLGWQVQKAAEAEAPESEDSGLVPDPMHIEVEGDIVCAINSLGELVIDMDDQVLVKLYPDQAIALKRFLGNTSILEELAAGGVL